VNRRLCAPIAVALAASIAACGSSGESVISEDAVRDCLGHHGATLGGQGQGATGYAPLFHVAADFQGSLGGGSMNVFVEKNSARARSDAADAEGALASVGVQNPSRNMVAGRNVVVVFDRPPSASTRATVRSCLD
jgi:hypothetical protein